MNKKIILGIIVVILLAGGFWLYKTNHKKNNDVVTQVQTSITDPQKKQMEDDIRSKLAIANDTSKDVSTRMSAWLQVGIDYESLGQLDKEKDAFLKAAEVNPKSATAWSNLASLYVEMKDNANAKQAFEKALGISNTDPNLWIKWINFNRYQLAASDVTIRGLYNDSYKATGNNDMLLRQGASYLEDMKDYKEALAAWEFILKRNPKDTAVKAEIARLKSLTK